MWFLSMLAAQASPAPGSVEASTELLQALLERDAARIDALLTEGLDPWPTIDRLREAGELEPGVNPFLEPVVAAAEPTPKQVAVRGRAASAQVGWLDTRLVEAVSEPLLCVAAQAGDAWLAAEALRRGEVPSACDGQAATLIAIDHPEALSLLLDARAPVDACALSRAVERDVAASVDLLLAAGASPRHGCGGPLLAGARSEAVVGSLVRAGADPFEPTLQIESRLRSWPWVRPALEAPTAHAERRDLLVAWAWVAGVDDPASFRPWLPDGWGAVPHRSTPGVGLAGFHTAWAAAGGAAALVGARSARLGDPLELPCAVPTTPVEAKASLTDLERAAETEHHRLFRAASGFYEQRLVDGRWETEAWSAPLSSCPALAALVPLLPALLGAHPWLTTDGRVLSLSGDRFTVATPR